MEAKYQRIQATFRKESIVPGNSVSILFDLYVSTPMTLMEWREHLEKLMEVESTNRGAFILSYLVVMDARP